MLNYLWSAGVHLTAESSSECSVSTPECYRLKYSGKMDNFFQKGALFVGLRNMLKSKSIIYLTTSYEHLRDETSEDICVMTAKSWMRLSSSVYNAVLCSPRSAKYNIIRISQLSDGNLHFFSHFLKENI